MITFNQLHNLHLLVVGILVVYLFALVNSSGLSVRISPKKFTQYRGQYVVFHCYVTGNPVPIVTWYSKGKDITRDPRTEIGKVPGGYIMRLGPVHPFFDNGTLECRGKNGVDPLVSDKAELRVLLKPFAVLDPNLPPGIPKPLARYNPNLDVYVGANITLVVNVSGNPLPKITWFKGNRLLDWSNPRFTLLKNNSLRITNAQVADQGRYDYMAENDKGQIFPRPWNIGVDYIKTKPGFKPGLKNQVVDPETDIVLNCLATGYPKPDVLWKNSKNRTIQEDGFLRITSVRKSETYRCFAKNELGNATISVNVTLSGLPFAPRNLKRKSQTGYSLTVSWQDGEAGTKIDYHDINYRKIGDVYWRTVYDIPGNLREYRLDDLNAYTYYEVQVFARNKVGKSKGSKIISMMTDETAPGSAPHSIVVKSTETGSFEVSWLPPEYPNGRISFYTIYYSDEPHKSWETWPFTFATKSPRKISQIQNDRRYAVMISSSTGTSAAGPISEPFLVQTLQGAPSNPQNVQAKVISSTKVELTWKKPSYEGSGQGIVGYDIYYNTSLDGTRNKVTIQSPDDFSNVVTGLSPATIYKFDIAARTDAGSGPLSFPQFATTWEGAPSAPPNNFSCTAIDESHIHCSWRPPPRKDRNGLIIGYMIRCKLSNKDTSVKKSVNNSVLSMTLDKLQAYTVYHIDVAAKSSKGQGPFSDRIVVTTHETTPSKPPENMTATAINSTAIYVTWKAPTPPFGAKLTGYQFRYREKPQEGSYRIIKITGNKRRILLTSLKPEQDYEFVIAAKSAKGTGRLTKPVVCKTKQAPPKPPVLVSKKLAAPQVGVALSWRSIARDIEQFQLRYAKDVEKITNETLLSKLTFVEKTFSSSVTAYNATNLGHGLWYVFKISVKNVGGWSTEREAWLLMDATKPTGPPLNFRVEPKTSTSVQLSWDSPEKWKRNGKIIGYELSYLQVGSSTKRKNESLDDKRLFELQGLKKFTSYQFRILAKTVAGDGPTVSIEGMTKEDVPSDSPTLTDAVGMGTKVVRLKFKPPLTPNGRIIGYKVNIYLSNPTYAGKWRDDEMNENKNEMYVGKLLKPDSKYWFTVAAKTSVGYGPFSDPIFSKTLSYDLPLPVRKLSVDVTSSSTVKLQWDSPVDTAAVHSYKISYRSEKIFIGSDKKEAKIELPEEIKTVNCCKLNSASLENLEPCTEYTVEIVSVSKSERASESKKIKIKTKVASSPMFPQPNISRNGITEEYIPIYVHPASERYGPISHYLIYVASLGKTISEAREKLRDIRHSRSRRAVNTNGRDDVHIAGKLNASVVPTTFKVGRGQIKNGYTNRRLELGHFYAFSIRSCVLDENLLCLTTSTAFTDPVEFSDAEVAHTSGTGNEDTGNNIWLLGPVCAVLALIVVITVICLLWRRRARRREGKPNSLKEIVHDDQLPMMTSPRDPVEMQRLNLETEGMREHPPIHICDLGLHIEHLRSNNNNVFTREYESIDPGMTFTSEISAHHLNQSKNRYPNIVPYDHTRAVLEDTNGFQDSDYINANYLAGYRKPNAYIATQAPLTNTINDFWQMIWEQDTRTIVMMTNLQEKGRIKCDQYWPINQSSEKFGNISVVVLETVELAHYTVRTFRLCKDGQNDKSREMKQYQYTAWPDHGVPHYSTSLLCFIRKVRLANPSDAGPVIVHCSAGVGRTGVFIVIDSMLEKMRREQTVDVYGHVTLLRSQRNHMVQTEEQYIFIHETLLEAVLFGNTEIHASDLSQYYKKLNEIGVNETTSIEEHFKQLSVFCHTHRFVTPILAANKSKNRYPKIIPYEHSRVDLVPVRSVDGSNYINASYIDGYKQRRTYIAAQGPLEETVNDFWRMIMEKKSNIVVMLSGTDDNDQQMSATYWPSEKSAKYHFYIVDPVSVEETPNFTLRQFKVNDMMSSCPSLIKLFQLRKWPDRGKPQSYKAILDLIGQVHIARNNDETKGPVVVHCGSGSGRTGVFCALSIVVERMRAEGVVDLLQTVRQLREQRPQMVETLEEYAFCYEAALQYLSSFDHITA